MPENSIDKKHEVNMVNRKTVRLTGVTEVVSFDDKSVVLKTNLGELTVEGDKLHISSLDTVSGVVAVEGTISSLDYDDRLPENGKKGVFGRLLG